MPSPPPDDVTPVLIPALEALNYLGIGVFAASGAGRSPAAGLCAGVVTACLGGIIRDVLAGQPSILMRPELYFTAAALSSGLMVALSLLDVRIRVASVIAAGLGFALRAAAIVWRLGLPAYGPSEPG